MGTNLKVLEEAIFDVGYWNWWSYDEDIFQLEFGWVQLYIKPNTEEEPPSNTIAIRFIKPKCVIKLEKKDNDTDLPDDWFQKINKDEIEPFNISYEKLTLTDIEELKKIYTEADKTEIILGDYNQLEKIETKDNYIAFWAGSVGMIIISENIEILSHQDVIKINEITIRSDNWWEYWKKYWKRKDTNPMPIDNLCEITIPAEKEE